MWKSRHASTPVDSGYAWVILAASFFTYMLAIGHLKTFGILYAEFLEYFHTSAAGTAWVNSVMMAITLGLAPLSNYLCVKFTFRKVIILGGLLFFAAYISTSFVPKMEYMYLTMGVVGGLGCTFTFPPCTTIVSLYFVKRRALANGIVVAGSGIGTFFIPYIYSALVEEYGLRGCMLISGAIYLNACVGGCFMVQPVLNKTSEAVNKDDISTKHKISSNSCEESHKEDLPVNTNYISQYKTLDNHSINSVLNPGQTHRIRNSKINVSRQLSDEVHPETTAKGANITTALLSEDYQVREQPSHSCGQEKVKHSCKAQSRRDRSEKSNLHFDWTVILDPVYPPYAIMIFLGSIGYGVTYFYIAPHVEHLGLGRYNASLVISVIGGTELFSRLFMGWFIDLHIIKTLHIYGISMLVSGIVTFFVPQFDSTILLCVFGVLFGISGGSFFAVVPLLLIEEFGIERFPSSFGMTTFVMAVASLTSLPLAGWIKDLTGDWICTIFFVAGVFVLSSISTLLVPLVKKVLRAKRQKEEKRDEEMVKIVIPDTSGKQQVITDDDADTDG